MAGWETESNNSEASVSLLDTNESDGLISCICYLSTGGQNINCSAHKVVGVTCSCSWLAPKSCIWCIQEITEYHGRPNYYKQQDLCNNTVATQLCRNWLKQSSTENNHSTNKNARTQRVARPSKWLGKKKQLSQERSIERELRTKSTSSNGRIVFSKNGK